MGNLFDIQIGIMNCIDEKTGEILDEAKLEELELDESTKIENIACWVKELDSEITSIKAEADAMKARIDSRKRKRESLDGKKFVSGRAEISWRKSESLDIAEGTELPPEYLKPQEAKVDKAGLKKAVKGGLEIKGVLILITSLVRKNNIQIK